MSSCKILLNVTRNYSRWSPVQRAILTKQNMVSKKVYTAFQNHLPKLVNQSLSDKAFDNLPEIKDLLRKITEYNVGDGKQLRGLLTLFSYETIMKPQDLTEQMWNEIFTLAWVVEMVQSIILIADDVDDGAETRRGKKCWHLLPDVGPFVINDFSMMLSYIHEILKQNFIGRPYYPTMINILNETFFVTSLGQNLDFMFNFKKLPSCLTEENYRLMSSYKTSYYSYQFPISLALLLSQKGDQKSFEYIEDICKEIGINFQMQNDFMDCFTDEKSMGKTGSDIPSGKLCWPAVEALKRCNAAQRKEFTSNYGKPDTDSVERIRSLYLELNLPKVYQEQEQQRYEMILRKINSLPTGVVPQREVFFKAVDIVFNQTQMVQYA